MSMKIEAKIQRQSWFKNRLKRYTFYTFNDVAVVRTRKGIQ